MDTLYIVIVAILFLLAASDLIVGVSNDAVNFLNSAIGSKVASFRVIMAVAAVGILFGAVFSSGMMEVARKGIFNPGMFYFTEIMIIFLAVMITDVILLDAFNTLGLPTSTTVSIVFELLGAAVAMASIKLLGSDTTATIGDFINSSKALAIISGILVSVAVAFSVGALIQYLTRMAFSFNYKRRIKYIGAIWGGIAFTAMTYFILIKGAKSASFMSEDVVDWIKHNTGLIMWYSFFGWTLLLQLLYWLFRINILKLIVLVGTFSLAMAFAGNDLVNFIGVPIAGFNSYELFVAQQGVAPDTMLMTGLAGKVPTPTMFLVLAGVIMVLTLYFSKKAKSVIKTSLDLSRQTEGEERFKSTWFSKVLVRSSLNLGSVVNKVIPEKIIKGIESQFEPYVEDEKDDDPPAFDLVRASVNLTVASILIAFGTSLKLPLSTTYVTFMVVMGTSLSDKAWDRESAVYRISGVMAVIGGWFLTAFTAFTVSFIILYILHYGGIYSLFGMLILVGYIMFRTHLHHKKSAGVVHEDSQGIHEISEENLADKSTKTIIKNLNTVIRVYGETLHGMETEDIKDLKRIRKELNKITAKTKYLKDHIKDIVDKLKEDSTDTAYYFVEVLDYMREILHSISFINEPILEHVDNNHKPLLPVQLNEFKQLHLQLNVLGKMIVEAITKHNFDGQEKVIVQMEKMLQYIEKLNKNQLKRLKASEVGTKNSVLYLNILNETKNMVLQLVNLYKSQRDFVDISKKD